MASYTVDKVIKVAKSQVGYHEKGNNIQKYGQNGQPWCCYFVQWCFKQAYGSKGRQKLLGDYVGYCLGVRNIFKGKGRWHSKKSKPKVGDLAIWTRGKGYGHIGIVIAVSKNGKTFTTIEGNHGDKVAKVKRSRSESRLLGFCRPKYTASSSSSSSSSKSSSKDTGIQNEDNLLFSLDRSNWPANAKAVAANAHQSWDIAGKYLYLIYCGSKGASNKQIKNFIVRCEINTNNKKAKPLDAMVITDGVGHGQALEYVETGGKAYLYFSSNRNSKSSNAYYAKDITRVQYKPNTQVSYKSLPRITVSDMRVEWSIGYKKWEDNTPVLILDFHTNNGGKDHNGKADMYTMPLSVLNTAFTTASGKSNKTISLKEIAASNKDKVTIRTNIATKSFFGAAEKKQGHAVTNDATHYVTIRGQGKKAYPNYIKAGVLKDFKAVKESHLTEFKVSSDSVPEPEEIKFLSRERSLFGENESYAIYAINNKKHSTRTRFYKWKMPSLA